LSTPCEETEAYFHFYIIISHHLEQWYTHTGFHTNKNT